MRTTLTIDDEIAKAMKEAAHRSGKSYKHVVNETLRAGLIAKRIIRKAKPYRLKPTSLGKVSAGYDLTKALQLADHLEDEEIARKLDMKK
jgi:hypothetical protein